MSMQQMLLGLGGVPYEIEYALRLDGTAYLNRTPPGTGNRKTWTLSWWLKRGTMDRRMNFGAYTSGPDTATSEIHDTGQLMWQDWYSGYNYRRLTSKMLADPSAWYHIVLALDTTQGTAGDRCKVFINGEQQTSFAGSNDPSLNHDGKIGTNIVHAIGTEGTGVRLEYDGGIAEYHFLDGVAATASAFGKTDPATGQWIPIEYEGSYGDEGYYLDFSDNSSAAALGYDKSGNSNHWTVTNIATTDRIFDTPTNNWCTLNPLNEDYANNGTFSECNLKYDSTSTNHRNTAGTIGMKSGKWYFEFCNPTLTDGNKAIWAGVVASDADLTAQRTTGMWHVGASNGRFLVRDGTSTDFGSAIAAGSVIQAAVDMDNSKLWIGINNTWYGSSSDDTDGNPSTGANPTDTIAAADIPDGYLYPSAGGYDLEIKFNAGQDSSFSGTKTAQGNTDANGLGDFYYTPPTGFKALCTKNLPATTIKNPEDFFNTVLYTGSASSNNITGVGFQPNLVWCKNITSANKWAIFDSVRGVTKRLRIDSTDAEVTDSDTLTSFDSDGFSLGADAAEHGTGGNTDSYASYNWKESSQAGFDIVGYTGTGSAGATISHGLGVTPEVIIIKNRDDASDYWSVYHHKAFVSAADPNILYLNTDAIEADDTNVHGTTVTINSSVFSLGDYTGTNTNGDNHIAYLFAGVEGYSQFGSYTGTGETDGVFIYTGFKPAMFIVKNSDRAGTSWRLYNNRRPGYNQVDRIVYPDTTSEDTNTGHPIHFLSNGIKLRGNTAEINSGAEVFIYMAFAESPFKYTTAG